MNTSEVIVCAVSGGNVLKTCGLSNGPWLFQSCDFAGLAVLFSYIENLRLTPR